MYTKDADNASARTQFRGEQKPWHRRGNWVPYPTAVARATIAALLSVGVAGKEAGDSTKGDRGTSFWDVVEMLAPLVLLTLTCLGFVIAAWYYRNPRKFYGIGMSSFALAFVVLGENEKTSPMTTLV